jgi:hypothetical protein
MSSWLLHPPAIRFSGGNGLAREIIPSLPCGLSTISRDTPVHVIRP